MTETLTVPLGLEDAEPGLWIVVDAEGDPFHVDERATGLMWVAAGHSERDLRGAISSFNPSPEPIPGVWRFGMTTEVSLVASIRSVPDGSVAGFIVFEESGREIRRERCL